MMMRMENEGDKTDGEYKFDEGDDMEQLTAHSLTISETIFGNWKPWKMAENPLHFALKALFVLKIFNFGHV